MAREADLLRETAVDSVLTTPFFRVFGVGVDRVGVPQRQRLWAHSLVVRTGKPDPGDLSSLERTVLSTLTAVGRGAAPLEIAALSPLGVAAALVGVRELREREIVGVVAPASADDRRVAGVIAATCHPGIPRARSRAELTPVKVAVVGPEAGTAALPGGQRTRERWARTPVGRYVLYVVADPAAPGTDAYRDVIRGAAGVLVTGTDRDGEQTTATVEDLRRRGVAHVVVTPDDVPQRTPSDLAARSNAAGQRDRLRVGMVALACEVEAACA